MVRLKRETYSRISDVAGRWASTITIGLTTERGMQMFSGIYSGMHRRYPEAVFQPVEANVEQQTRLLDSGQLDLGFQTICERRYKHFQYERILEEPFVLCVPNSHPLAHHQPYEQGFPSISLRHFRNDLFTLVKKTSTMREAVDRLFEQEGFRPRLLFESVGMRSMQRLAECDECCCIIPRYYAIPSEHVSYFLLEGRPGWELCEVHLQGHHLNKAARDLIEAARSYWHEHPYSPR